MKNKTLKAKVANGELRCPNCGAMLAKAYYGSFSHGVEVKCKCREFVFLELEKNK